MFAVSWIIIAFLFGLGAAALSLALMAWAPIFAAIIALVVGIATIAFFASRRTRDQSRTESQRTARPAGPTAQRDASAAQPARGGGEGGAAQARS